MIGVALSFCCFLFLIILASFYFSKQRVNSLDNKFFSRLIIINIIGIFIDIAGYFSFRKLGTDNIINIMISKVYLFYYLTYTFGFMLYVISIAHKGIGKYLKIIVLIYALVGAIMMSLPINLYFDNNVGYSYGLSVNFAYVLILGFGVTMLVSLIRNLRKVPVKKYIPLFTFIVMTIVCFIIQKNNPEITILLLSNSLVTFLIYFTIENPDVKVINELNRNKDILEKNNEDRSNFLFKMTQEVRKPVSNIENLANMIDTEKEYVKLEDIVSAIKSNTRQISYIVNDVLDVSDVDVRKIKIENNKYDARRLFEEINLFIKEKVAVNVNYSSSISSELPKYLNGDNIKIKQAIMSILINSAENTKRGFIDLNVSVMVKYDMCRLIITIEDSGCGMNIGKVNDILTLDKPLDEVDEKRLQNMDVDLNITKKIVNIIGGTMMIKSEVGKGSKFIVVIDQKIVLDNNEIIKHKYNYDKKRVLIVEDNLDILKKEKEIFKNNDIDVVGTMYGLDAVNRIRSGEKFDYIILDDETVKGSAKNTLDDLKCIEKFNMPVVVMLEKNKEMIKDKYKEIGFSDYILKEDIEKSIEKFIKSIKSE